MNLLYSDALQLKLRCACFRWYACVIVRYVLVVVCPISFCVGVCKTICVLVCVFISCLLVGVCLVGVGIIWLKIIYQDIILFLCYYTNKIILFFVWYWCKNIGFIC